MMIYQYDILTGWTKVPHPLLENEDEEIEDAQVRLGFESFLELGNEGETIELWVQRNKDGFLTSFWGTPGRTEAIWCRNVPSLLEVLGKLVPIIQASTVQEATVHLEEIETSLHRRI